MDTRELLHHMIEVSYTTTGIKPTKILLGDSIYSQLTRELRPNMMYKGKLHMIRFEGLEVTVGIGTNGERLPDTLISIS